LRGEGAKRKGCVTTLLKRKIIPYNPKLMQLDRNLRKQGILSEILLWNELKGKKMMGYDFHRQRPIGNYIVDFFCHEMNLVIEIDGSSHTEETADDDENRQKFLESLELTVLRFYDGDVKNNLADVIDYIKEQIKENALNDIKTHLVLKDTPLKRGIRK
jgi:very-short-patch-repair endonuclease